MCGGFTCSKNALTALNILYILVAFILIGVAVYGRESPLGVNLPTIGGILACGVFLFMISIVGLIGAVKHHQVLLFFYMLILFLLFLVQFSVACACLAVNMKQQEALAKDGWDSVPNSMKAKVQKSFKCCGFDEAYNESSTPLPPTSFVKGSMEHLECPNCCPDPTKENNCVCHPCMPKLQTTINYAFKLCGGIGLFFSFTEFLGVWLTVRYRNQKDPRANPSAFL